MRPSILLLGAILVLCGATGLVSAQMVVEAGSAGLQPQIARDESGFKSCGVRAVVVVGAANGYVDAYDFSLMVSANTPYGTLKAGKSRTTAAAMMKGQSSNEPVMPQPIKFWIAEASEGKSVSPIKIFPAQTKGYILEIADFVATYEGILATIHGRRMQFAVRYKSEPVDVVVSFSAEMPENERGPLLKCLDGITARLAATLEEKEKQAK